MRLYVCMTACGSICTLMYILLNSALPYELPLRWRKRLFRLNIIFYLLPVPWFAAELRTAIKTLLKLTAVERWQWGFRPVSPRPCRW